VAEESRENECYNLVVLQEKYESPEEVNWTRLITTEFTMTLRNEPEVKSIDPLSLATFFKELKSIVDKRKDKPKKRHGRMYYVYITKGIAATHLEEHFTSDEIG
jgi:hypothetical protein